MIPVLALPPVGRFEIFDLLEVEMSDVEFLLTREQRDRISKAAAAIEESVKEMMAKPDAPAEIVVLWTNLAIIQWNLANVLPINSN